MKILSAYDLKMGKTTESKTSTTLTQPIQMLSKKDKNEVWKKQNMDWFEQLGMRQIADNSRYLSKLGNLADGIIDKNDYIPNKENEEYELINNLRTDEFSPYELKFYPIIPQIVNVLTGEFSKRSNKVHIYSTDEFSINEMLHKKQEMVQTVLISQAQQQIFMNLQKQGIPTDSEEAAQAIDAAKALPYIERFFKKDYRSIPEQWASKQLELDTERFRMYELENENFRNSLVYGREFFHIDLREDDYCVELWHPLNTFYHKSPSRKYISTGDYVGRIHMMTVADIIQRYGYLMTEQQFKQLQNVHNNYGSGALGDGHDLTAYYDTSKSPADNLKTSAYYDQLAGVSGMYNSAYDYPSMYDPSYNVTASNSRGLDNVPLGRVSEIYWKSQKKMGHLTKILEDGTVIQELVTEDFKITEKGLYDQSLLNIKDKSTLIFGEHVDWIWVNEVWKGVKISPNFQTLWTENSGELSPIYLDVRPIKYQFKGLNDVFGTRLPVEGFVNVTCPVNQMKPFQIQYNMVNNQMADILIDEVGTVILLDQNMLPKQSLGESWGPNNFQKAYQVMKDFSILPVDTSITNLEAPLNFNHFQSIDLSQDKRLASRIQLANHFKQQAFETIGITPQRLGSIQASESATGVQQAVNNSYAQTETYFTQHSNFLMPRVYEMMLGAAQYYNSTKPSVQLSYTNSEEEKVFFSVEGYRLLLPDFNILCSTKPDRRAIIDKLKELAIYNNTTNATIYDLGKILAADTITEIVNASEQVVKREQEAAQSQMQQQQQQFDKEMQERNRIEQERMAFESEENRLDREAELLKAQIMALGYSEDKDLNMNNVPDALEVARFNSDVAIENRKLLQAEKVSQDTKNLAQRKLDLEARKLALDKYKSDNDLLIAIENTTQNEIKQKAAAKNKKK
jgi:hypothetical protein